MKKHRRPVELVLIGAAFLVCVAAFAYEIQGLFSDSPFRGMLHYSQGDPLHGSGYSGTGPMNIVFFGSLAVISALAFRRRWLKK